MKDKYCVCGNEWTQVFNTTLYDDCYYCQHCDKVYKTTVIEVPRVEFQEQYSSDRFGQIKKYALIKEAMKKVSHDDLMKLGYL